MLYILNLSRNKSGKEIAAGFGFGIAAVCAAVAHNLMLSTSVGRKFPIGNITKGVKTPSQVIVKEVQPFWNENDVHTSEPRAAKL
jgi:hypothetical protein